MYPTSCLPSSFPFNKTYAVAVTKEEATKSRRVGHGTGRSWTTGYHGCSAEQERGQAGCQPSQLQGGALGTDHQEMAATGRPHHLLQ